MKIINHKQLLNNFDADKIEFNSKKPFKYIVLENFLNLNYAEDILEKFPKIKNKWTDARGKHTQNKWTLPTFKDEITNDFMIEAEYQEQQIKLS